MNVSESCDLGVVLDHFLGLKPDSGFPHRDADVLNAAMRLADRAHKTMMAGLDGRDVKRRWKRRPANVLALRYAELVEAAAGVVLAFDTAAIAVPLPADHAKALRALRVVVEVLQKREP